MQCNSCGAALQPGAHFCANCGAPLQTSDTPSPVEPLLTVSGDGFWSIFGRMLLFFLGVCLFLVMLPMVDSIQSIYFLAILALLAVAMAIDIIQYSRSWAVLYPDCLAGRLLKPSWADLDYQQVDYSAVKLLKSHGAGSVKVRINGKTYFVPSRRPGKLRKMLASKIEEARQANAGV